MSILSQGPFAPTAFNGAGGGGTLAWSNPSNVALDDGVSFASVSTSGTSATTRQLLATAFPFSIPLSVAIVGVVFTYKGEHTTPNVSREVVVGLTLNGTTISGTNKAANSFSNSLTLFSFGSSIDFWGNVLSPSIVNSVNFGIGYVVQMASLDTVNVDAFRMTIFYNAPTQFFSVLSGVDS